MQTTRPTAPLGSDNWKGAAVPGAVEWIPNVEPQAVTAAPDAILVLRSAERFLSMIDNDNPALALALAQDFVALLHAIVRREPPPEPKVKFVPADKKRGKQ